MNDLIQSTLADRATRTDAGTGGIDLDAVISQGRQRVRRRRVAGGVGALAAVAVLGIATPFVLGGGSEGPQVARDPGTFAGEVSWGDGSQVRVGDRTIDIGAPVTAYVLTDSGIVAVDDSGTIRFADGVGEPVEIGVTEQDYGTLLVADGDTVAWYDAAAGEYVSYDTAARDELRPIPVVLDLPRTKPGESTVSGEFETPGVRALDGTTLWAYADKEATGFDLTTGGVVRTIEMSDNEGLQDASGGLLALNTGSRQVEFRVEDVAGRQIGTVPYGGRVDLSPDGTYAVTDANDSEQVFDVASGDEVTPEVGPYDYQAVVQWLSDDTYQALATTIVDGPDGQENGPTDFLVCSITAGSCEVAAQDVGEIGAELTVPVGQPF